MNILTFTNLYPNRAQPRLGLFVEQRLRKIVATGEVEARVVAPVPWFPFGHAVFGAYGRFARVPATENRHGIEIDHPRYPLIPKVGMTVAPYLMKLAMRPVFERVRRDGFRYDLIDAQYLYPDGVAAAAIARHLGIPVVLTARGSDVNLIARYRRQRNMIRRAAGSAACIVTVSAALKSELESIGIPGARIEVLRNGVDLERFRPTPTEAAVRRTGFVSPTVLSVGNLVPNKGHHLAIAAIERLPGVSLVIVGQGPMRRRLEQVAESRGVANRVRFAGTLDQDELPWFYSAADCLVLASEMEGMPNVVLESLACGTPVVATDVGGVSEVIAAPQAGRLVTDRSAAGIAAGLQDMLRDIPARTATRAHAEQFGWDRTIRGQIDLFRRAIHAPGATVLSAAMTET